MTKKRVLIMGAAGRDFHNFNVFFRNNEEYEVAAFTATQIPNIEGRRYPPELSGPLYPRGIPIHSEKNLADLIEQEKIDQAFFSYSDVSYEYVMQKASVVLAAGADFRLLAPAHTQLASSKSVIAVCAVRTGCGKSPTSRKVVEILKKKGRRVAAVRHPMPYGDLTKQIAQRFASYEDLDLHKCTIEEREEFEPYIDSGLTVFAGVDYEKILAEAEREADIIIWDGGNNDLPFFKPNLHITVMDPLRAGHERSYYPGEVNFIDADVLVINKYAQAGKEQLESLLLNIRECNQSAAIVNGDSKITVDNPSAIKGKRVLVIEDGPTLTHGGMGFGAGTVAARQFGAKELVDPRAYAVGSIKKAYAQYPHLGSVLPALGYYPEQLRELEATVKATPADMVLVASPIDLRRVIKLDKPSMRVRYYLEEIGKPTLEDILQRF